MPFTKEIRAEPKVLPNKRLDNGNHKQTQVREEKIEKDGSTTTSKKSHKSNFKRKQQETKKLKLVTLDTPDFVPLSNGDTPTVDENSKTLPKFKNGTAVSTNERIDQGRIYKGRSLMPHPELQEDSRGRLSRVQVRAVNTLLDEPYQIVSKDGQLTISITSKNFLYRIRKQLRDRKIIYFPDGHRLVGSGAAAVLLGINHGLNDLDFSIYVRDTSRFHEILELEEIVLSEFIYEQTNRSFTPREVYDLFFLDSLKVETCQEVWSLVTIGKKGHKTIDIKFVAKSKRSFAFSVDSFEIALDPFYFKDFALPETLMVESLSGHFENALMDLREEFICTQNPEEIRRGLFRYTYELAKGRKPKSELDKDRFEEIFVDAFLVESHHMNFDDVLSKFILKHSSYAEKFLKELYSVLSRRCNPEKAKHFLEIIQGNQKNLLMV